MGTQTTERCEHRRIEYARERITDRERRWLRGNGWSETSSTPGNYWMWQKEWEGKTFLVDQETAARIQGIWDSEADYQAHPEDYED